MRRQNDESRLPLNRKRRVRAPLLHTWSETRTMNASEESNRTLSILSWIQGADHHCHVFGHFWRRLRFRNIVLIIFDETFFYSSCETKKRRGPESPKISWAPCAKEIPARESSFTKKSTATITFVFVQNEVLVSVRTTGPPVKPLDILPKWLFRGASVFKLFEDLYLSYKRQVFPKFNTFFLVFAKVH